MLQYRDRLSDSGRDAVLKAIHLALIEIERMDVDLEYTNIVLKDITNTILGGELLCDMRVQDRGRQKLHDWLCYTNQSGGVTELNSPAYTPIALRVLHTLSTHTSDREVAVLARAASARIGLSYTLRIHPETGRLAGPYSRAYLYQVLGQTGPEIEFLKKAFDEEMVPNWLLHVPDSLARPAAIIEGCNGHRKYSYTTWMSDSYTLGTATQELDSQANRFIAGQSNVFCMHFHNNQQQGGVVYCRYILDDKWVGDFRTATARPDRELLLDEGRFFGAQDRSSMIGVYAPRGLDGWQGHHAAKLAIVVSRCTDVEEILVNNRVVQSLPIDIPEAAVVGLKVGCAFLAFRPFSRTNLGQDAPLRLLEREGDLVFEIYNYAGLNKTFWELATPGSFYQGQPRCAFYAEAAECSEFDSLQMFVDQIKSGRFTDSLEPFSPQTRIQQQRSWQLVYTRAETRLGLNVDLWQWRLLDRWTSAQPNQYQRLDSSVARQVQGDLIQLNGDNLHTNGLPLWFYAHPPTKTWVFGGYAEYPTELILELAERRLHIHNFRYGVVTIVNQTTELDTNPEATFDWE